jgi:hypothetical protein
MNDERQQTKREICNTMASCLSARLRRPPHVFLTHPSLTPPPPQIPREETTSNNKQRGRYCILGNPALSLLPLLFASHTEKERREKGSVEAKKAGRLRMAQAAGSGTALICHSHRKATFSILLRCPAMPRNAMLLNGACGS